MNEYEAKQQARRDRLEAAANRADSASQQTLKTARRMGTAIPFGQPILIDHYSAVRDRNYRARITSNYRKGFALMTKAEHLRSKAASVGKGGISSDDPEAIKKLHAELATLEGRQERMKAANKVIRQRNGDEEEQVNGLLALGWLTNEQARDLIKPDFCGRVGYPSYAITNNNANIRRIKQRIADLEKQSKRQPVEVQANGYIYREDINENRVMFIFDGKPDEETRSLLKSHGFKWSPSRDGKPWVRQLTGSAIYAGQCIKKLLDAK